MTKSMKYKAPREHRKYCHCTPICTSKINRKTRLQHYRQANIPFNRAPRSVTATESDEEGPQPQEEIRLPAATRIVHNRSGSDIDDVFLGSGSEYAGDLIDEPENEAIGHQWQESELGYESEGLRMDVDEGSDGDTGLGDSDSERGDLDDEGLEFDEWKEFDEEAEARSLENLSNSDRLSELDLMLDSDDLAADADEAEGWTNRMYSFRIQTIQELKEFFNRKEIFNGRRP